MHFFGGSFFFLLLQYGVFLSFLLSLICFHCCSYEFLFLLKRKGPSVTVQCKKKKKEEDKLILNVFAFSLFLRAFMRVRISGMGKGSFFFFNGICAFPRSRSPATNPPFFLLT